MASVLPPLAAPFRTTMLLEEEYVVAMRRDHPAVRRFDIDYWLAYPHVLVSGVGATTTPLDAGLAARGLSRRIGVVVPSFLMVAPLLIGSDLVAMLPSRCVPLGDPAAIVAFPPPFPVEGFRLDLAWHNRRDADIGVRHVANEMLSVLGQDAVGS